MRYAPAPNIFFVHIPKNGGQSVRNAMREAAELSFAPLARDLNISDAEAEALAEKGTTHPRLGSIHPAHLPLWAMQAEFPECWKAFEAAKSFALTRDPRDRFLSALMQRLKEFRGAGAIRAEDPMVAQEARAVCDWLSTRPRHTDLEYIHFVRQVDFTDIDGTRLVDAVFPTSAMDAVSIWFRENGGIDLTVGHDHARRQPKPWARGVQPVARFAGRFLMPKALKRALHPLWMSSGVFSNAAGEYARVDLGKDVEDFIASHYAADAALHEEAKQNASKVRG